MQQAVKCKNCGIKWLRVTEGYGELVLISDLQPNCPKCGSNWCEVINESGMSDFVAKYSSDGEDVRN
jgi:Zn finger protein HypA/HybF involved in hydrogenase expression